MDKTRYKIPSITVDIIIIHDGGYVLIERKNPPYGWALPGGFVDYGETLEQAAIREAKEETGLEVTLTQQFHTYSSPTRDVRRHTISVVFVAVARGNGLLRAADDAINCRVFAEKGLPEKMAFDHRMILEEYINNRH